jgi:quinol monooxygenase YgiN
MIIIVATVFVTEDTQETYRHLTAAEVLASRAEDDGCISYTLSADVTDPTAFNWCEIWRDQAAVDAHHHAPRHQKFLADVRDETLVRRTRPAVIARYSATDLAG